MTAKKRKDVRPLKRRVWKTFFYFLFALIVFLGLLTYFYWGQIETVIRGLIPKRPAPVVQQAPQAKIEKPPKNTSWLAATQPFKIKELYSAEAGTMITRAYLLEDPNKIIISLGRRVSSGFSTLLEERNSLELIEVGAETTITSLRPDSEGTLLDLYVMRDKKNVVASFLSDIKVGEDGDVTGHGEVVIFDASLEYSFASSPDMSLVALGPMGKSGLLLGRIKDLSLFQGTIYYNLGSMPEMYKLDLSSGKRVEAKGIQGIPSPSGQFILRKAKEYQGDAPESSTLRYMVYEVGGVEKEIYRTSLYLTYSEVEWDPPVLWLDDENLVLMRFEPEETTEELKNFKGKFSIIKLNRNSGFGMALVKDSVAQPTLLLSPDGKTIFYNQVAGTAKSARWQLWGTSREGKDLKLILEKEGIELLQPIDMSKDGETLLYLSSRIVRDETEGENDFVEEIGTVALN